MLCWSENVIKIIINLFRIFNLTTLMKQNKFFSHRKRIFFITWKHTYTWVEVTWCQNCTGSHVPWWTEPEPPDKQNKHSETREKILTAENLKVAQQVHQTPSAEYKVSDPSCTDLLVNRAEQQLMIILIIH